jgi:hypothetical protein
MQSPEEIPQNIRPKNWNCRAVPAPTGDVLMADVMRPKLDVELIFAAGAPSYG